VSTLAPPATHLLEVRDVRKHFRGVKALDGVSLAVEPGEILGLIGPNGSGKTTLLNVISGVLKPTSGDVAIDGTDTTGRAVHKIAALGVARTFQQIRLFRAMSVTENVEVGAVARGLGRESAGAIPRILARARVADYASWPAGMLSYGQQRRVEIARALAGRPRLLLLDEPAAGLSLAELDRLGELIAAIGKLGTTVVIVEHHLELVANICSSVTVLERGAVLASGTPAEVFSQEEVISAYMGSHASVGQAAS
jgi:branched-chain amino acid transport system permease protein